MIEWLRQHSAPLRILVYVLAATLAFAIAAGVGAGGALLLRGDLGLPGAEQPQPPDEQRLAPAVQQYEEASPHSEAEYITRVGDIQANSVETSLDSHDKLLRYDALTTDDVENLQANEVALRGFANQVDDLDPPPRYEYQYGVFRSAINELHEAAQLAYDVVADPTAATKSKFDEYDRHVEEADRHLQESNESLGRDYETLGNMQKISPL